MGFSGHWRSDIVTRAASCISTTRKIKQAAIKARLPRRAYADGTAAERRSHWNEADDNKASRQAHGDGRRRTLSTEVAVKEKHQEWYFQDIVTHGSAIERTNEGKARIEQRRRHPVDDPEGGEESPVARNFIKYFASRRSSARSSISGWAAGAGHAGRAPEPILEGPEGPAC